MFPVFDISGSGLYVNRKWMDAIADNIANVNTVYPYEQSAFRERFVVARAKYGNDPESPGIGGGVELAGTPLGNGAGLERYEPGHPFANEDGIVRYPDIDLADQMTQLIAAQRAYQLNVAVIDRARDAYQQALRITGR
jgi:flagellar basal-body rod protein FlgC